MLYDYCPCRTMRLNWQIFSDKLENILPLITYSIHEINDMKLEHRSRNYQQSNLLTYQLPNQLANYIYNLVLKSEIMQKA